LFYSVSYFFNVYFVDLADPIFLTLLSFNRLFRILVAGKAEQSKSFSISRLVITSLNSIFIIL